MDRKRILAVLAPHGRDLARVALGRRCKAAIMAARDRRGNAVVEMALVLMILLMVLFGITEFGRAWMTANVLETASREGARLAVVTDPDWDAVEDRVNEVLDAARIEDTHVTHSGPAANDPSRKVTVTVSADFQVLSKSILRTFRGTIPLHAETTMRHESF